MSQSKLEWTTGLTIWTIDRSFLLNLPGYAHLNDSRRPISLPQSQLAQDTRQMPAILAVMAQAAQMQHDTVSADFWRGFSCLRLLIITYFGDRELTGFGDFQGGLQMLLFSQNHNCIGNIWFVAK